MAPRIPLPPTGSGAVPGIVTQTADGKSNTWASATAGGFSVFTGTISGSFDYAADWTGSDVLKKYATNLSRFSGVFGFIQVASVGWVLAPTRCNGKSN